MSIDRISSATTAIASLGGGAPVAGQLAGIGARSVGFEVAGRLAGLFLEGLPGGGAPAQARLGALADTLGSAVSATALETVEIEHAMEGLAGEVAADLVAFADGRTLDRLEAAIAQVAGGDAMPSAANVIQSIEQIAAALAAAR